MSAILTVSDGSSDNQKRLDFINDEISLRVAPLVDRIRFGDMSGDYVWNYMNVTVGYTNTAGGVHPGLKDPGNGAGGFIDRTTMAKPIAL